MLRELSKSLKIELGIHQIATSLLELLLVHDLMFLQSVQPLKRKHGLAELLGITLVRPMAQVLVLHILDKNVNNTFLVFVVGFVQVTVVSQYKALRNSMSDGRYSS